MSLRQRLPKRLHNRNWTLLAGLVLVGFLTLIAIIGPELAPQDPMKENYTLAVDGQIRTPPYPALKIDGYPLGTDRWGRDLLSRILWGVRPTLIMVASVAAFRLAVGIILGLLIGWAEGRRARQLDSILSSLLSIPVLIVALIGIYAIGVEKGLWAFIFGLGITGWAETARMVSEQTRVVKRQTCVEAARALGSGERQILFNHILRQIMSLVWVLLAFEISSTLLVSAGLGFLGYFIGGGIWIEVTDFQAVNVEGLPELGQMLSSALVRITDPTALVVVGTIIFAGVLGFNLLGEGLRIELTQTELGRRVRFVPHAITEWYEVQFQPAFRQWSELHGKAAGRIAFAALLLIGGSIYYDRNSYRFVETESPIQTTNSHLWATELHDAYGTLWVPVSMETLPEVNWEVQLPGGASGGPAVSMDGTVYAAGLDNRLMAFNPQGELLWESPLDAAPIGAPALDAEGRIFVADLDGNVTAFDAQGNRLWRVEASATRQSTSGPVVASSGMIYLTLIDAVVGISPEGTLVWRVTATDEYVDSPPRLSADESLVFLKSTAIDARTGQIQAIQIRPENEVLFTEPAFFTGVDGRNYYRNGHEMMMWQMTETGPQAEEPVSWEAQSFVLFNPVTQGVTSNGLAWMFYGSDFNDGRVVWIDEQSRLVGNYRFPHGSSRLIAMGGNGEAYLCGPTGARLECVSAMPGSEEPLWSIFIDNSARPIGGALVPGTLYVTTEDGTLYALSAESNPQP